MPDELPPDAEPEPNWKTYENSIARIERTYENCKVTQNHKIVGRRSGVPRQVDVWLEAEIGDDHTVILGRVPRHAAACAEVLRGQAVGIRQLESRDRVSNKRSSGERIKKS